jgi:anti-sigma factor RsiW
MECSQRGAISEEELLAYLAGEDVRPAVLEHLASCPACTAQVEVYRRLELTLMRSLYRWDCPPAQVLGEYHLGLLSNEMAVAVRFHLGTCMRCAGELALLSEFLAVDPVLAEAPLPAEFDPDLAIFSAEHESDSALQEPPASNHHQPQPLSVPGLAALRERAISGARRIIATLLTPQPRLAYQRELARAEALWPQRYSAEDFSISLHVERGPGRREALQLIGFVTRKGTTLEALQGTPVLLVSAAGMAQSCIIDELGNFLFDSLAPATYTLELQFSEGTVVIEQLQVMLQH